MPRDIQLIRLNKYIAQCGISSRRGADELVFSGKVTVNGTPVDSPGIKVDPERDVVMVDGQSATLPGEDSITIMLHKPVEVVTTANDPQGRQTVLDLLPENIKKMRPFPVGRLDFYSEGLLLLTTDGELCYRLTHPNWHLPKVYEVTIRDQVPQQAVKAMREGMVLKSGEKLAPARIFVHKPVAGAQVLEITLIQGINRQVRRMCEDLDMTILRLRRVRQGPLSLDKLKRGAWRELTGEELAALKKAVMLN